MCNIYELYTYIMILKNNSKFRKKFISDILVIILLINYILLMNYIFLKNTM